MSYKKTEDVLKENGISSYIITKQSIFLFEEPSRIIMEKIRRNIKKTVQVYSGIKQENKAIIQKEYLLTEKGNLRIKNLKESTLELNLGTKRGYSVEDTDISVFAYNSFSNTSGGYAKKNIKKMKERPEIEGNTVEDCLDYFDDGESD